MTNQLTIGISFGLFLLLVIGVGILSSLKAKKNNEDYILASRDVNPLVMAVSAVSSLLSGFMFIAFVGFAYTQGVSAIFYPVGWVIGDFISWLFIHKNLREKSKEENTNTITSFIGTFKGIKNNAVIKVSSIISIIFLSSYAAAQFKVGSKAMSVFLGWEDSMGVMLAGAIVLIYCFSGGIRASIWTDVIQSVFMVSSMIILLVMGVYLCGGIEGLFIQLNAIDPNLTKLMPTNLKYSFLLFFIAMIVNGFAVIGQPHVMVRPMLIREPEKMNFSRNVYIVWYFLFSMITLGVGLVSRVLIPDLVALDPENALPHLAVKLLPSIFVGFTLAGVFSAALSTADSQIISCSASFTQDLFPRLKNSYLASKLITVAVTGFAVFIAITSKQTVFSLIEFSWSALGVTIGVLLLFRCLDIRVSDKVGILMMISGLITVFYWKYFLGISGSIHEALPGFIVPIIVYLISERIKKPIAKG